MSTTITSDELAAISKAYSEMEFVGLVRAPLTFTPYKTPAPTTGDICAPVFLDRVSTGSGFSVDTLGYVEGSTK